MPGTLGATLASTSQRDVAKGLVEHMITRTAEQYGRTNADKIWLRDTLNALHQASWGGTDIARLSEELRSYSDNEQGFYDKRRVLLGGLARMGQLYELAGLVARDNRFKQEMDAGRPVPGGSEAWIASLKSPKQAIEALKSVLFGMTFTAHPTNVVSLDNIRMQRKLAHAIDKFRYDSPDAANNNEAAVINALNDFVDKTVLTLDAKDTPRDSIPADETEHMLHYVNTLFDDLPHVYKRFDAPLAKHRGYDPLDLHLNIKLASWGSSGDKDGNKKVNADTTLHAIAAHKELVLNLYGDALARIDVAALAALKDEIADMRARIKPIRAALDKDVVAKGMTPDQFDAHRKALKSLQGMPNAKTMESALTQAYRALDAKDPNAEKLLDMIRRVRLFGSVGAQIEYRETSDRYSQIMETLIQGYQGMTPTQKTAALSDLLAHPGKLNELRTEAYSLAKTGAQKPYSDTDAGPIAYHTLKRLELARDFPEMIDTQVLAECEGTHHILEAQLLQKLAHPELYMHIVPLFEKYYMLEHAGDIMTEAYTNPAYASHLKHCQETHGQARATQQVQLAHSDNARRAGMPAARAYIYDAHRTLRKSAEKAGIAIQFYEGGSQSDPYRGGVRALSATINEFGIHEHAKFTIQGGDLLNYLNQPSSAIRMLTRNLSHSANSWMQSHDPLLSRAKSGRSEYDETRDNQAVAAMKRTVSDYENYVFNNPAFNEFMEIIGYNAEKVSGNVSTRAGARGDSTKVNVHEARTISFSEALQHAGITPTFIGARNLYSYLYAERGRNDIDATELHCYYKMSPVFRDVVDRMLFGLAKTDIDGLRERMPQLKHSMFLDDLEQEYRYTARLALAACTGKPVDEKDVAQRTAPLAQLRERIIDEALPHLKAVLTDKNRYMDVVSALKTAWCPNPANAAEEVYRKLAHAAGDTVHHGRYPAADDPGYAQLLIQDTNPDNRRRPGNGVAVAPRASNAAIG